MKKYLKIKIPVKDLPEETSTNMSCIAQLKAYLSKSVRKAFDERLNELLGLHVLLSVEEFFRDICDEFCIDETLFVPEDNAPKIAGLCRAIGHWVVKGDTDAEER